MPDTNIPAASADDNLWAADLKRQVAKTVRAANARTILAEKFFEAIENKQPWRLNHLLTTSFTRASWPFGGIRLDAKTLDAVTEDFRWNRSDAQREKYFRVEKNIRKAPALAAVAVSWPEGVTQLMAQGLAEVGGLRDCILASIAKDDPATTRALIGMVPAENQALWRLDDQILEAVIKQNRIELLKELVKDRPSLLNETALGWAATEKTSPAITDFLLEQRAEAVKKSIATGPGLLVWALRSRNSYAALKLIDAGADVTATTDEFRTLPSMLQLAVAFGLPDVVSAMLDKGADPYYRDISGHSIVTVSFSNGRDWENVEKALAVLAERGKIEQEEAKKLLLLIGQASPIYPAIRKIALVPQAAAPGASWHAMGPEQIGMVSSDAAAGIQITELFNFATSEHLIVSRDTAAQKDSLLLREAFADVKNAAALEAARSHLAPKAPSA